MMNSKAVLALVVFALVVLCTEGGRRRRNRVNVGVTGNRRGARLEGEWSTGGRNWRAGVGGSIDTRGNWGVGARASWSFKKRSISDTGKRFEIMINIDQCHFDVYDIDGDGAITLDEMRIVFFDDKAADELFKALDLTTADGRVTKEEFQYMVPRTIANCVTTEV